MDFKHIFFGLGLYQESKAKRRVKRQVDEVLQGSITIPIPSNGIYLQYADVEVLPAYLRASEASIITSCEEIV